MVVNEPLVLAGRPYHRPVNGGDRDAAQRVGPDIPPAGTAPPATAASRGRRHADGRGQPTLAAAEMDRMAQRMAAAIHADPVVVDALAEASAIVEEYRQSLDGRSLADAWPPAPAIEARLEELWQTMAERLRAPEVLGGQMPDETLAALLLALVTRDPAAAGTEPLRFLQLPSAPGRVIWATLNEADVRALRSAVAPGQVWIRADLVRADAWPIVRAMAANSARLAGIARPGGRPAGSPGRRMAPVVAAVAARPELTNAEIIELARPIWSDLGLADDYDAVRRRVGRIRRSAERTNKG